MKDITWDESLSVEIEEIDEDHRRLVDLFNLLSHSVAEGGAPEYVEALLDELISCTAWHFKHEERLMIFYKYREFEEHKAEHNQLIESVNELRQKFHQDNRLLTDEHIEFLSHWLTEHILGQDMKLGFYLIDAM